jgi:4-hydroxy-tetrahydrodipicolinate reductase
MGIKAAITGACGRMGRRLVAVSHEDSAIELIAAIGSATTADLARDAGEIAGIGNIGLPVTHELRHHPDVLIDFSTPPAARHWLKVCRDRRIPMVIGTTGLHQSDHEAIDEAAADIPIVQAPNMSLGVNLLFKVAAEIASRLGDDYDIEIVEGHHRFKKDAPSGTAMGLADAILNATGKGRDRLVHGRHGDPSVRTRGDIGMHALRIGDEIGRHTAYFAALGERLEMTHVATNRDTFVHGAIRAAKWVADKPAGRYTVADVLGI